MGPQNSHIFREYEMVSLYFTATILSENKTTDRVSYHSDPDHRSCKDIGPPPAPVALFVCRESRELALKRYCLAFGGTKHWHCPSPAHRDLGDEDWERCRHGEKRIWVDFERDTLVAACVTASDGFWQHVDRAPLSLMAQFAPVETRMLRRVAVGGFWTESWRYPGKSFIRLKSHYQTRPVPGFVWSIYNSQLWKFPNLKELVVYYSWEETDEEQSPASWTVEEARGLVVDRLNEARSRQQEWISTLPVITLVKDLKSL